MAQFKGETIHYLFNTGYGAPVSPVLIVERSKHNPDACLVKVLSDDETRTTGQRHADVNHIFDTKEQAMDRYQEHIESVKNGYKEGIGSVEVLLNFALPDVEVFHVREVIEDKMADFGYQQPIVDTLSDDDLMDLSDDDSVTL